jgi:hypothetical protein
MTVLSRIFSANENVKRVQRRVKIIFVQRRHDWAAMDRLSEDRPSIQKFN